MPNMAIVDADMMMNAPKGADQRHAASTPLTHDLEAYRHHDGHRLHRRPGPAAP